MALTLYHAPASIFSQRARFALAEKKVKYKSVFVEIHGEEQLEPWYARIHPLMTVPSLVVEGGSKFIDSEAIIAFADQITPELPPLFPDEKTSEGQKCRHFLQLFKCIEMREITMGTIRDPQYTIDFKSPAHAGSFEKSINSSLAKVRRYSEQYKDLRYVYLNKATALLQILENIKADNALRSHLDVVESVLNQVETELGEAEADQQDVPPEEKPWLSGQWITMADICLATILHRLVLVGYSHYWTGGKRPNVERYYQRILQRESFRHSCLHANNLFWSFTVPLLMYKVKLAMPWVIGASAVVAAAAGVYIYIRKH